MRICNYCKQQFKTYFKKDKKYSRGKNKGFSFRGVYCSRKCQGKDRIGEGNSTWNSIQLSCRKCSKIFFRPYSLTNHTGDSFCSKYCYDTNRKATIKKNCLYCKKEFIASLWKIKNKNQDKYCSMSCRSKNLIGELAPHYIDGRTPLNEKIRQSLEYKEWMTIIKERDNYICQICGTCTGPIHANHIKKFSDYPKLRFELTNGITICKKCHEKWVNHHEPEWESYFNFNLKNRGFLPDTDLPKEVT